MIYLLYTVHVLVCVFLILVVLLQHGKGADFSVFGGGSTQTAFGSRGTTTFLHKLTVFSFVVFVLTTLAIGIPQFGGGGSVLRGTGRGKAAAGKPATPPAPASTKPGASPASPNNPGASPASPSNPGASPASTGTPASPPSPRAPAPGAQQH